MRWKILLVLVCCAAGRARAAAPASATPVDTDAATAYGPTTANLDDDSRVGAFDRQFLEQAAQSGHARVVYAKLALRRAESPNTRAYAQRVINDQMATNSELRIIAEGRNIIMPTELTGPFKQVHEELARLEGHAFDDAYAEQEARGNIAVTNLFRQGATQSQDSQVRVWATHRLPLFEQHVQLARELSQGHKPVS